MSSVKKAQLERTEGPAAEAASVAAPTPAPWLTWVRTKIRDEKTAVIATLVLGALLFFPYLGSTGLWDPWETHYGEVAREMIVRDDYVYPYWESAYFFSKPALSMWLMVIGMLVVGAESPAPDQPLGALTEWGMRMPFALIAIGALWAVYRIGRQLRSREAGLLSVLVLASSAQFIFIGKQAMVDMPTVGFLTISLALFIAAVFDQEEDGPANSKQKAWAIGGFSLALFPQLMVIGREMRSTTDLLPVLGAAVLGLAFVAGIALKASRRDTYLVGFYTCMGLATLAKGPVALLIVGPTVIVYMAFSGDWRILIRSKVLIGGIMFLLVGAPWYVTLSLFSGRDDEGKTFVQRFWLHDTFGRFGAGVHGDRAGLGYFIEQLAYGMFPWIAVIPAALGMAAKGSEEDGAERQRQGILFVLVWAVLGYTMLTMSQTKFHHYIFPVVPALAILVGLWLERVAQDPAKHLRGWGALLMVSLFAVAARDLINEPQHLVNLFTYKYDRDYPRELDPEKFLVPLIAVSGVALAWFWYDKKKDQVLLAFVLTAVVFGAWVSHVHFNMLSPHWGQAHLFKTYFAERQGDEPIYAYQLNWRGETFYSRNRILQVKEGGANERMRSLVDRPGREFIITEQSRFHTLKGVLSADKRDKIQILDRSNNKFYLCVVEE